MNRRDFINVFAGSLAATLPLSARAQDSARPVVGVLMLGNPDPAFFLHELGQGLHELRYMEGQNITLELRNAHGSMASLKSLARELVELKVDVIVGFQTPSVVAAKEATTEIPIVMCPAQEPVEMGFVASYARPGGNITGMTTATAEITGKNLDLIREALPAVRRLAAVGNTIDPFHKPFLESVQAAAPKLGFQLRTVLTPAGELEATFAELAKDRVEVVLVQPSLGRELAAETALKNRLPLFAPSAEFARAGGLMAYGADSGAVYRQSATFVDKIIKGRKPADLPVELATKFLLVINLKTANALGITLSPTLLARADEVIE
jgi:putative tryptophan/tyrosine transport system substrate-binding protein